MAGRASEAAATRRRLIAQRAFRPAPDRRPPARPAANTAWMDSVHLFAMPRFCPPEVVERIDDPQPNDADIAVARTFERLGRRMLPRQVLPMIIDQ